MFTQILFNGLVAGAIYALVALGFSLRFQATRTFDFSYAAVITLSAYAAGKVFEYSGANWVISALAGCTTAGTVGVLLDVTIFRPMRRSGARELAILLASLGTMVAVANSISLGFGDRQQIIGSAVTHNSIALGSARITSLQLATIYVALMVGGFCWYAYHRTRWGLVMRALADDEVLARCYGISRERLILQATILAAVIGSSAAILSAMDTGLSPLIGFQLLLPGVVASVVGGMGRLGGVVIAGCAIGLIQQAAGWITSAGWQDPILFAILLVFLLVRPHGVFGAPLRRSAV